MEAWKDALAGDPVSAFGGVLICNKAIDKQVSEEINKIFFELIIAPEYSPEAIEILKQKKNRIILKLNSIRLPNKIIRTVLNGILEHDRDSKVDKISEMKVVTQKKPSVSELSDLEFANIVVKHTKSNAIVLVKNKMLYASGTGQTSRVDALMQAIEKARAFKKDINGAVMASDAFFPFPDCVEIAHKAGITAVVQPGGSVKDQESINYCDKAGIAMVFTGTRHFKH
jgi:phosphoribosylaminoimidazolecarboxamide formyltransferase/IMP cyclohydrolase